MLMKQVRNHAASTNERSTVGHYNAKNLAYTFPGRSQGHYMEAGDQLELAISKGALKAGFGPTFLNAASSPVQRVRVSYSDGCGTWC